MSTKVKKFVKIRSVRFCLGCLFAAAAFAISVLAYDKAKAGLFFAVLFLLAGAVKIPDTLISRRGLTVLYAIWLVLTAFVTLFFSQFCLNEALPDRGFFVTLLGTLLILCLYLIPFVFTLKIRVCVTVVSAILILFTCLNYFVFLFRGSEIAPADLLSVTAAGNVAAEYSFRIPAAMFYALILSVIYYSASFALPAYVIDKKKKTRIVGSLIALVFAVAVWIGGLGVQPLHWRQTGFANNGYLLNFTVLFRESFPQKPSRYSPEIVRAIAEQYESERIKDYAHMPDIIVIMDESFADLSILGNPLHTDDDITPFIDGLQDNTVKGYALSSVFGGGTPNSEYEFLTGNSMLFLPLGAIVYQQFIHNSVFSMAQYLKEFGYQTIAMHPCLSNSWMRESIWPRLGFEESIFIDGFPGKDILRNFITDREMFDTMIQVYEDRKANEANPVFIFGVTMQNHGGYNYEGDDFTSTVKLDYNIEYPEAEQFLTCMQYTDHAVEGLINYFNQSSDEVVILFFGDHFPKLNDQLFEEIHGGPFETIDEQMLLYEVPFFIWSNYDSKEDVIELTSLNYLSNLVYEKARIPMPSFNLYLQDIHMIVPAMNAFGYYSISSGCFLPLQDASGKEIEILNEYNLVEWNCMFDKDNRELLFFSFSK